MTDNNNSKEKLKKVFAKNLNYYIEKQGIDKETLARQIDIPINTVREWCRGVSYPHVGRIEKLATLFGISKSDLIEETAPLSITPRDEAWEIRKVLQAKPHLKILFAMTVNISKEDIEKITKMIEIFSR